MRISSRLVCCAALLLSNTLSAQDSDAHRDDAWDLTEIYPSVEAWDKARLAILERLDEITARKGTLGESPASLYSSLRLISDTQRELLRVHAYASLKEDEDLRDGTAQERNQLAEAVYARFAEATAWLQPEIIRIGRPRIEEFIQQDSRLAPFVHDLDNTLRQAAHTLNDEAEQALAYFAQPLDAPGNIYGLLANADIPFPSLKLSDGKEHRIDSQGYELGRTSPVREDRKAVFDAFWGKWLEYRNSIGMVLNAHIQSQVAMTKARRFNSMLERELFSDDLPPEVYRTLVAEVNKALPILHRYFRLRARMLGLEQLHYYDIYPPLVKLERKFDLETSKRITLEAMSILGVDWVRTQREAMDQRWMHVYPRQGKRSGAYMNGSVYDVHPYLLLNHQDNYNSLSTLSHEWGHAMHTLHAREAQPFETVNYATFIAEIPSTSLELILEEYMVKHAATPDEELFYLGSGLESLRGTFFRQTMFAEFELRLYETVEKGEALTGERISRIYGELLRRYHGHAEGVVVTDDLYENEWMFVPHFYRNMYVFQYATSLTAGTALYNRMEREGATGVENFKNLLRAGGSDYPYRLLLKAGVDLASPEPYREVTARMSAIMDRMEVLLEERAKK
ncbi:MAG: oligoendopeptidase F [Gammaproteobacteria bacterium]|nr:MAG: oligoendopeptidase F [Gammaproteobacteria bacterium]